MGKKSKLLIVAICFIIIGVILLAIGYVAGGYENIVKKYADNDNLVYINKELDSFEDLDITLQYGDVEIISGDKYFVELSYNKKYDEVKYDVQNNKLIITSENKKNLKFDIDFFGKSYKNKKVKVKIYVPEGSEISTSNLNLESGDLILKNLNIGTMNIEDEYGDNKIDNIYSKILNIEASSGDIEINNVNSDEISLICEYGDIDLKNINSNKLKAYLESGELDIDKLKVESLVVESEYGDIFGKNLITNGVDFKIESGDVDLSGELRGQNTINSEYGDIDIKTSVPEDEYEYDIVIDYGDCVIGNNSFTGSYKKVNESKNNKFTIISESGDIKIKF